MRSSFAGAPLASIAHIEMGQSPDSSTVKEGDHGAVPFLQGNAEFGVTHPAPRFCCTAPMKMCRAGDILISVRAPVGAMNIADREYCIGRGLAAVRVAGMSPTLAAHMVSAAAPALRRVAQGTTFEAISKSDLASLVVMVAPREDREPLGRVLDTLDTTIRQTEVIIEKLKRVKQGLLHDLLTRGIDANGELRPPQCQAPLLYKDSPLGWIPREWRVQPLRDLGNFTNGLNKPKHAFGSGTKFVNISDVYADYMDTSALGRVQTTADDLNRYCLEPGDIVLDRSSVKLAGVGYPSVFDGDVEPVAFCGFIIRLRLNDQAVSAPRYLCLQMRAAKFRNEVFKVATGGANINVNQASLGELLVVVPRPPEQKAIVERERAVDDRLEAEGALREKLCSQKSGLMDDLLTGRVRVTPLLA